MKQQSIFQTGVTVTTREGKGEIVRIKPNKFRNRHYEVRHANGQLRWYSLYELQQAYKLALNG